MAYIGNTPAENYASFLTETFTVSATANYTLSHAVTNENDIRLVINGVVQQPGSGKAYTASGTTLTLSSATVSGDVMYAVYLGRALQTVNPPNASVGSSQVAASIITGQTALGATPADTDELLISDAGTLKRVDYSYLKSANTPAFLAKPVTAATLSDDTITKISFTEAYDSDNKFDGSKFTPGTAGHYQVNAIISLHNGSSNGYGGKVDIYKNGSVDNSLVSRVDGDASFAQLRLVVAGVIYLDADDYIEVYASFNTTSGNTSVQTLGQFSAFKIIT